MRRRTLLLSIAAGLASFGGRARAYYQIDHLMNPHYLVVGVHTSAYKNDIITPILPLSEPIRDTLIEYLRTELQRSGIDLPVGDSRVYVQLPEGLDPSGIVQVDVRIDIGPTPDSSTTGPAILGAASVSFTRNGNTHHWAYPFTFFTSSPSATELKDRCVEAAIDQLDRAVIAQLKAEMR